MLSIVVPIYNAGKHLKECIDSVLEQSFQEFELLLVDDGSEDNSVAICKEYEKTDDRIKVLSGSHEGPYLARKQGALCAKGDYITFIDADDFISKEAYTLAVDDMKNSIDIIVFGISRYYDDDDIKCEECRIEAGIYGRGAIEEKFFPMMIWDSEKSVFGIDPTLCCKLYKTRFMQDYYSSVKDLSLHYGEDVAVTYPLISRANNISIHKEIYYRHRQRPRGVLPAYIKDDLYLDKLYNLYKYLSEIMQFNKVFQKQIDLFYIYSVGLARRKYGMTLYSKDDVFPFDQVEKGAKIVIYGAGNVGKLYVQQLKKLDYCQVVLWVDQNYEQLGGEVCDPRVIMDTEYDKVVVAIADKDIRKQATETLITLGVGRINII